MDSAIGCEGRENVAIGKGAMTRGNRCVAIGIGAEAHGDGSMAIGHGVIARDGERKVAIKPDVDAQDDADLLYEFFQSLRDSITGPYVREETENG